MEVKSVLDTRGILYKAYFTKYIHHTTKLIKRIVDKNPDCNLVVIGGDGTINEMLSGIEHPSRTILGYIPTGSGNDFARGMQIPANPKDALELILSPKHIRKMDLGVVETLRSKRRFCVSAGIGFDAAICHEALESPYKKILNRLKLGRLTYAVIAVKQILLYRPFPVTIQVDNRKAIDYPRTYFIAVMNQKYEGGGLKLCPQADSQDGKLHVCVVDSMSKIKILLLLPTAFWGKHTNFRGVHIFTGTDIKILSRTPLPVHSDGESCGYARKANFTVDSQKLSVITN